MEGMTWKEDGIEGGWYGGDMIWSEGDMEGRWYGGA